MPPHFICPAAWQQHDARTRMFRTLHSALHTPHSSHHRMPNKLHPQLWHIPRVPLLLKGEDAQEQIVILCQRIGARRSRRPDLWRNELYDLRIPRRELATMPANVFLDCLAKPQIESAVIYANNHIRLPLNGEFEQLIEQPAKFEVILQHLRNTNDRVL